MRTLATDLPTLTLVLGGTGKTGARVAERLWNAGGPVRLGYRSDAPGFDWTDPATWPRALSGASAVYVTYHPDILRPEAADRVAAFARAALDAGARRLVLLSRRGAREAEPAENALKASGADWTVIRASLLMQNFTEGAFALPASAVGERFIDAGDVADVVLRVLADPAYVGKTLELAGPQFLTRRDAVAAIASAKRPARRDASERRLTGDLLGQPIEGRNAQVTRDVETILGRPLRSFADFAAEAARAGAWTPQAAEPARMTA